MFSGDAWILEISMEVHDILKSKVSCFSRKTTTLHALKYTWVRNMNSCQSASEKLLNMYVILP